MHSTKFQVKNYRKICWVILAVLLLSLFFWQPAKAIPSGVFANKYAAIVIDANTGRVLFSEKANMRRYPASLTKMMTLYLLFDAVKSGRISADTPIRISAFANGQPPTKLNLGVGQTIGVDDAAKALITKSANDIAVAIAEFLGGTEQNFARMMTLKARQLGMRDTNFANASGLPNIKNYSTARDLAILALALRRDFPRQYVLFSTTTFVHQGRVIHGHNRLVSRMAGVDGIKTGYTQMSGFNLASSRRLGNKSIVAVVMGGKTSALRDGHMVALLTRYMGKATNKKGFNVSPPVIADAPTLMASVKQPLRRSAAPVVVADLGRQGEADIPVPTAKIAIDTAYTVPTDANAVLAQNIDENEDAPVPIPEPSPSISSLIASSGGDFMSDRERDSAMLMMLASQSDSSDVTEMEGEAARAADNVIVRTKAKKQRVLDQVITASLLDGVVRAGLRNQEKPLKSGWIIQVAAGKNAREAKRIMHKTTHTVRRHNVKAEPYIEKFVKHKTTYYRVRYSGFTSKAAARNSCSKLKKTGIPCIAVAS